MERPIDAVTSSVLRLQIAQRAVNSLIQEVIDRVSIDPLSAPVPPDLGTRLSELRIEVDTAAGALMDALGRPADEVTEHPPTD